LDKYHRKGKNILNAPILTSILVEKGIWIMLESLILKVKKGMDEE
jgi:hypothetical protein